MQQPPSWLEILSAPTAVEDESLIGLHEGERAVIALAESRDADLLVIDERAGAEIARRKGLAVTGTLGVLDLASRAGAVERRVCATAEDEVPLSAVAHRVASG
jgi:predicted nucleic acid-binding protein